MTGSGAVDTNDGQVPGARTVSVTAGSGEGDDVEVVDIVKDFGDVRAVDGVSFALEPGTFFALLGPSGCGKTTLLRMIAGLEQPTAGDIRIGGRSITSVPAYRRNVNTVFQQYALFPHMDVAQNVGYGPRQQKRSSTDQADAVEAALQMVRLAAYGHRRTWELSGGQQQRVALARALINHPAVLLLDEPLGALDLQLRHEMQIELKRLQSEVGITFIFVTHDQNEALSMANRIAVMRGGRVLQDGSPDEIYESPVDRWVATFVGQMNFFEATVVERDAAIPDRWVVRTSRGLVVPAEGHSDSIKAGASISLALRPERVRVHAPGPSDGPGHAPGPSDGPGHRGRIISTAYLGDQIDVQVDCPELGEVLARVTNDGVMPAGSLQPGKEVVIDWLNHAARLVVDGPES